MGVTDLNAIESVAAYVPRYRITADEVREALGGFDARGVEEKRVAGYDEDAVTMAVEAARDAIDGSTHGREEIGTLALGTTTPPVDEGDVGAQVAEILGLDEGVEVTVYTQSTRAGTRALLSALRADGPALAVAADCPRGSPDDAIDHAAGAGAVAVVTSATGAVEVTDVATCTREYAGTRFRRRGSETVESYGATAYERDAYTTTVAGAVERLSGSPTALAVTAPDGSLPHRVGRSFDGSTYHLAGELGDTGAASAPFALLAAWDAGEESVALVGYGDGASADALAVEGSLRVDWERPAETVSYAEYLRKRGLLLPEGGER